MAPGWRLARLFRANLNAPSGCPMGNFQTSTGEIAVAELRDEHALLGFHDVWYDQHKAAQAQLFVGPDWYAAWRHSFGAQKRARALQVTEHGKTLGVVPLVQNLVWRRPWLSMHHMQPEDVPFLNTAHQRGNWLPLRQISMPVGLQCGSARGHWSALPGRELEVVTAVGRYLAATRDWDVLLLPGLPTAQVSIFRAGLEAGGLRVAISGSRMTLFGLTPQPWESYFRGRSRHFRKRFQAAERGLAKLGTVRLVTVTEPSELPGALDRMFTLAARSRKQTPREGQAWYLPLTPAMVAFYSDLCRRYAASGGCVFNEIYVDERLAGTLFCVIDNGTAFALQTYFDDEFASGSPGRLLLREIIDWAAGQGLAWIDLNGNSPIVRMFATEPLELEQAWAFRSDGYSAFAHGLMRTIGAVKKVASARTTMTSAARPDNEDSE